MHQIDKIQVLANINNQLTFFCNKHVKFLETYFVKEDLMFTRPYHDPSKPDFAKKSGSLSTCFALLSLLSSKEPLEGSDNKLREIPIDTILEEYKNKLLKESSTNPLMPTDNIQSILDEHKNKILSTCNIENQYWTDNLIVKGNDEDLYDIYTSSFKLIYLDLYRSEEIIKILQELRVENTIEVLTDVYEKENEYNKSAILSKVLGNVMKKFYLDLKDEQAIKWNENFDYSAFLSYYGLEAIMRWFDMLKKSDDLDIWNKLKPEEVTDHLEKRLVAEMSNRLYDWTKNQIYRQISYYENNDVDRMDPVRSVYCVLIYKKYHQIYPQFREMGVLTNHRISNITSYHINILLNRVIENLVNNKDLWKKYLPIASKSDQEGFIYPFAMTWASQLITITKISDDNFDVFIQLVTYILNWVEKNEKIKYPMKVDTGKKYLNLTKKTKYPKYLNINNYSGWRSPYSIYPQGHPECWSTSLVFESLWNIKQIIKKIITREIVQYFGGTFNEGYLGMDRCKTFISRWDSKMKYEDLELSLKKVIYYNIIEPRLKLKKEKEWSNLPNSVLLYGPPGTGKTSLVESIADVIGWSFIRIDTGMFLKNGFDKAGLAAADIFDQLEKITKTVIIFDEIDELIKSRDNPDSTIENNLLTNTLLTLLNKLAMNKEIIFFIATNYSERIDRAITRPGRIDFKLFVDYPAVEEFIYYFMDKLENYVRDNLKSESKLKGNRLAELKKILENDTSDTSDERFKEKINAIGMDLYAYSEQDQKSLKREGLFNIITHRKSDEKEFDTEYEKYRDISLVTSSLKKLHKRFSDTDLIIGRSKHFVDYIIRELEKEGSAYITERDQHGNKNSSKLGKLVDSYFGEIGLDKINQIDNPSLLGSKAHIEDLQYYSHPDIEKCIHKPKECQCLSLPFKKELQNILSILVNSNNKIFALVKTYQKLKMLFPAPLTQSSNVSIIKNFMSQTKRNEMIDTYNQLKKAVDIPDQDADNLIHDIKILREKCEMVIDFYGRHLTLENENRNNEEFIVASLTTDDVSDGNSTQKTKSNSLDFITNLTSKKNEQAELMKIKSLQLIELKSEYKLEYYLIMKNKIQVLDSDDFEECKEKLLNLLTEEFELKTLGLLNMLEFYIYKELYEVTKDMENSKILSKKVYQIIESESEQVKLDKTIRPQDLSLRIFSSLYDSLGSNSTIDSEKLIALAHRLVNLVSIIG